jgi:formylglycine-generating enzyme required for sulfatase activity
VDKKGDENSRTKKTANFFSEKLNNDILLEMVEIPEGTFQMGSPVGEGLTDEWPQHIVFVPRFLMGKYPVTQSQWREVAAYEPIDIKLNNDPSYFKGGDRPVEQISWNDAVEFCKRLSNQTGHFYSLPSESQWEHACRAGDNPHKK